MFKLFNILKLIFKEKTTVKSYNSEDDLEQFVSRRINSKLEVNKTQKHENELLKLQREIDVIQRKIKRKTCGCVKVVRNSANNVLARKPLQKSQTIMGLGSPEHPARPRTSK